MAKSTAARKAKAKKPAAQKPKLRVVKRARPAPAKKAPAKKPAAKKAPAAKRAPAAAPAGPPPAEAKIDFAKLDLQDALDLAILIEEEARARYEALSKQVGGRYPGDAAEMFRMMAGYEAKHEAQLQARRTKLFGKAKRRVKPEQIFDVEAPDWTEVNVFMSPRQALEVSLRAEAHAHDFYAAAIPHVKEAKAKALFEELRKEEVRHQGLVSKLLEKLPPGPDLEPEDADEPGSDGG